MNRILLYILSIIILITCTRDAFEEEGEMPVVMYDLEVLATEGGTVSSSSGSYGWRCYLFLCLC